MARVKKDLKLDRQAQLPLENISHDYRPSPGFHIQAAMEAVKRLLRARGKSLEEMVEWMSDPARRPRPVSLPSARAWFAESKPDKTPGALDIALMAEYLNDPEPINILVRHLGWKMGTRREQQLLHVAGMLLDEIKLKHRVSEAERILQKIAIDEGW